jgi:predicted Abi (CAAX) family protease
MSTPLNLYLISQNENNDYDTYDSAVVAAPDENAARLIHPETGRHAEAADWSWTWVSDSSKVNVELIGQALDGTKIGAICSSYNAG